MNNLKFETFRYRGGKFKNYSVSVTNANAFGFLAGFTLRHKLQDFDYVSLSFSKPAAIGFKFNNDPKFPGNFKLTHNKSSASVSAHSFFQAYNINAKKYQGRKFEPHEHKDPKLGKLFYILLDGNNADIQKNLKKDYEK